MRDLDESHAMLSEDEDALEWSRGLWPLDHISKELTSDKGFCVARMKSESVRRLISQLGIKPALKRGTAEGGAWRALYDPLVCWVVYVALQQPGEDRAELAHRLAEYKEVANHEIWGPLAASPTKRSRYLNLGWDWRVDSTAFHLFITDVRHGLEPRRLNELLTRRPQLLYRTLDANLYLECLLRIYVANYTREYTGVVIDPNEVNLFAGGIRPFNPRRLEAKDTLAALRELSLLRPDPRRLSQPEHLLFDHPDVIAMEGGEL